MKVKTVTATTRYLPGTDTRAVSILVQFEGGCDPKYLEIYHPFTAMELARALQVFAGSLEVIERIEVAQRGLDRSKVERPGA